MQENKKLLPGVLLVLGMALLAGWLSIYEFGGFQVAHATPKINSVSPGYVYIGPGCMVEFRDRYSLYLPRGWFARTDETYTVLRNYDTAKIQFIHGAPLNMPEDAINIEMYPFPLEPDQTFGNRLRQQVSSINPFIQPVYIEYDWGQVQALGWKNPSEDRLLLEIYPGQGIWGISVSIWETPDTVLPQVYAILSCLKVPAGCSVNF